MSVNNILSFVSGKSFETIKTLSNQFRIKNSGDLYLLYSKLNETPVNGIILEKETNKVVALNYPIIQDIKNKDQLLYLIEQNNTTVEYCEDGTIIRLYNYNNDWYTSTTKTINAITSYWSSSKSFDQLFWELFDKQYLEKLDKNSTYFFVLLHKENRIVVKHKTNSLVYISRMDNNNFDEDDSFIFDDNSSIRKREFIDMDRFKNIIKTDFPLSVSDKRGVIIKNKNDIYKIDFESYNVIKEIRGNNPEIRIRYLELLKKPESCDLLEKLYKEYSVTFAFIKASVLKLTKNIHRLYISSHVKHELQVTSDHIYYRTLRQLHAQYKLTNNPIKFIDVYNKLVNLDIHVIKRLLNLS